MPADLHGHVFGQAGQPHVPHGRAPQIVEKQPFTAGGFAGRGPGFTKVNNSLAFMVENQTAVWIFSIAQGFLRQQALLHLPVDGKRASLFVFGASWIEPDLVILQVHLGPSQSKQLSQAVANVIPDHQERFEVMGECCFKAQITIVFQKTGSDVVLGQHFNMQLADHFGRIASAGQLDCPLNDFQLAVDRGILGAGLEPPGRILFNLVGRELRYAQ